MSSKAPLITIAVPAYRGGTVRAALESILAQDFTDYEILVSDNCVTGEVRQIVESFSSDRIVYTHNAPDFLLVSKLEQFVNNARSPWMVILGDDDLFEPGYLSAMADKIRQYPDASVIHTRYRLVDEKGRWIADDPIQPETMDQCRYLDMTFLPWYKRMVNITGVLFSVGKIRSIGGFLRTNHGWNADTAAWAWLGTIGRSVFENRPLVRICINPGSEYKRPDRNHDTYLEGKRLFFDSMQKVFSLASPRSIGQRLALGRAKSRFLKYWMREEARIRLEPYIVPAMTKSDPEARAEIRSVIDAIDRSKLPLRHGIFRWYSLLSKLPCSARKIVWRLFSKAQHAYHIAFPRPEWHTMIPQSERSRIVRPWRREQLMILLGIAPTKD